MEKYIRLKAVLPPLFIGIAVIFSLKFLLPLVFPVLLGAAVAALLTPLIKQLQTRGNLRHSTAAALCVTGVLFTLLVAVFLLGRFLFSELSNLYGRLPLMLESITRQGENFSRWAERFSEKLPAGASEAFSGWVDQILSSGGSLAAQIYTGLFSFVSGFLSRLPDNLLFILTAILSCYFSAAELPRLLAMLREHMPGQGWNKLKKLGGSIKTVISGYLRAQIKLMGITFLILLFGFMLLRTPFPLLFAIGISFLDALPLFGTGTILLPWGLMSMITGEIRLGMGLMALYGAAAMTRNILEPKFLGAQMGISPLATLLSIYVGYRISGLTGMILLPILVMLGAEVLAEEKRPTSPYESPLHSTRAEMPGAVSKTSEVREQSY